MSVRPVLAAMTAALVIALASPAMARETKEEREARYAENLELARAHAGEPVEKVRFLNDPYKFDVLGNHHLLVWQNQRTAWLVDLKQDAGCRRMANSLSISIDLWDEFQTMNTTNGYIVGGNGERCKIEGLRKVDVVAMRAARESAKDDSAS